MYKSPVAYNKPKKGKIPFESMNLANVDEAIMLHANRRSFASLYTHQIQLITELSYISYPIKIAEVIKIQNPSNYY